MPRMKVSGNYYTAAEVKDKLGITQGMFNNYIRNGRLKPIVPPGKRQGVYLRSEVDQLAHDTEVFLTIRAKVTSSFEKVTTDKDLKSTVVLTRILFGLRDSETDTAARRSTWIQKNPDILYALKSENQVVGYLILLPLKMEKIEKILSGKEFSQEVTSDEIETFEPGKVVSIYLMGIGVTPGVSIYEKRTYGSRLVSGMIDVIVDLGRRGVVIDTLAARSDTPDGIRLLRKGFTEIPSVTHARNFIIKVQCSGVPFIQEYKEALAKYTAKR